MGGESDVVDSNVFTKKNLNVTVPVLAATSWFFFIVSILQIVDINSNENPYKDSIIPVWIVAPTCLFWFVLAAIISIQWLWKSCQNDPVPLLNNLSAPLTFTLVSALLQITQLMTALYLLQVSFKFWGYFMFFSNFNDGPYAALVIFWIALAFFLSDAHLVFYHQVYQTTKSRVCTKLLCNRYLVLNLIICCGPLATGETPEFGRLYAWLLFVVATLMDTCLSVWVIYTFTKEGGNAYAQLGQDVTMDSNLPSERDTAALTGFPDHSQTYVTEYENTLTEEHNWLCGFSTAQFMSYLLVVVLLIINTMVWIGGDIAFFDRAVLYYVGALLYAFGSFASFASIDIRPTTMDQHDNIPNQVFKKYLYEICTAVLPPALIFSFFGLLIHTDDLKNLSSKNNTYFVSATVAFVIWVGYSIDVRLHQASSLKTSASTKKNKKNKNNTMASQISFAVALGLGYGYLLASLIVNWDKWDADHGSKEKLSLVLQLVGVGLLTLNFLVFFFVHCYFCYKRQNANVFTLQNAYLLHFGVGLMDIVVVIIVAVWYLIWNEK